MPTELVTWLLTQGPFAGLSAYLIWDRVGIKAELAAERTRNHELQESRLEETKVLAETVGQNRTTIQALLSTLQGKGP